MEENYSAELMKLAKAIMSKRIALTNMMESALKEAGYDEDFIKKADDFMFDNVRAMHLRKDQFLKFIQDNKSVISRGAF